jgi:two-component system sensor histidine kinase DegS
MLDHLGLVPGLKFLAQQISKRTGIQIKIETGLNGRLGATLELTLYRVIQEALNNVSRHSQARKAQIKLFEDEMLIQCSIEDDGAGFDPRELTRSRQRKITGLGLAGIRERVEALNGTYQILSAPGEGTKLYITLPLTEEKPDVSPRIAC